MSHHSVEHCWTQETKLIAIKRALKTARQGYVILSIIRKSQLNSAQLSSSCPKPWSHMSGHSYKGTVMTTAIHRDDCFVCKCGVDWSMATQALNNFVPFLCFIIIFLMYHKADGVYFYVIQLNILFVAVCVFIVTLHPYYTQKPHKNAY